jgi:hypothetical protein
MKRAANVVASLATWSCIAGCASGGGGGGGGGQSNAASFDENPLLCMLVPFVCILAQFDAAGRAPGTALTPEPFTTWAELKRGQPTLVPALGLSTAYESGTDGIIRRTEVAEAGATSVTYNPAAARGDLSALGQPGLERHANGVFANPYALGWNFQSFGAWNEQPSAGKGTFTASSFGQATPGSAVPASGNAAFTGKAGGFYVSPTGQPAIAASDLTVKADFSARSLNVSTSRTTIASDLRAASAAPHLDLNGTLSYAAGSSRFSGTLANAGGTLRGPSSGQFYGPAAQELGGVFSLKASSSIETFTGAYGAKR